MTSTNAVKPAPQDYSPRIETPPKVIDAPTSWLIRAYAAVTGSMLLAAATQAAIEHKGLTGIDGALMWAAAGGIIGAAIVAPRAPRFLALALIVAALAGELVQLASTAERSIASREAASAPARNASDARAAALKASADAAKALAEHRTTAIATAALPSCKANCAATLASTTAALEAAAANASAAVATAPIPVDASPLATRLGITPTALDLTLAASYSLSINGLAALLIGFAFAPVASNSLNSALRASNSERTTDTPALDLTATAVSSVPLIASPDAPRGGSAITDELTRARRAALIERLRQGPMEARQADMAADLGLPRSSLIMLARSTPNVRLKALPTGVSRLELVA